MALHRCCHQTYRQPRGLGNHLRASDSGTASELHRSLGNQRLESLDREIQRADRGFSLIEMLVALVVLSLSLGALYQAAMGATRNVRVAAEYVDAVMLAESMLADHSYVVAENYAASGSFDSLIGKSVVGRRNTMTGWSLSNVRWHLKRCNTLKSS